MPIPKEVLLSKEGMAYLQRTSFFIKWAIYFVVLLYHFEMELLYLSTSGNFCQRSAPNELRPQFYTTTSVDKTGRLYCGNQKHYHGCKKANIEQSDIMFSVLSNFVNQDLSTKTKKSIGFVSCPL